MFIKTGELVVKKNIYCGEIAQLLQTENSPNLSIAMAFNIKPTIAHYHTSFDEVYLVIDGNLVLKFFNPQTQQIWQETLHPNELCFIGRGIHHQIIQASEQNRLCVICTPQWVADDETESTFLEQRM